MKKIPIGGWVRSLWFTTHVTAKESSLSNGKIPYWSLFFLPRFICWKKAVNFYRDEANLCAHYDTWMMNGFQCSKSILAAVYSLKHMCEKKRINNSRGTFRSKEKLWRTRWKIFLKSFLLERTSLLLVRLQITRQRQAFDLSLYWHIS